MEENTKIEHEQPSSAGTTISLRISRVLLRQVDDYCLRSAAAAPGFTISRAALVRQALIAYLSAAERTS